MSSSSAYQSSLAQGLTTPISPMQSSPMQSSPLGNSQFDMSLASYLSELSNEIGPIKPRRAK